ncbi:unnamed protein product [Heligmosomoides polygyrus]|uniref:WD_REPEATS_REGION domain-containing protein n=1 Tax=Heligmosomoides polygyrus TaxID=6339 RepID=A0A183FJY1_HELPZ|nr:unnamed protein product [Heligmosomoides polygyrus]
MAHPREGLVKPDCSLKYSLFQIWDFATLAHVRDFKGHRAPITALCFQLKTNCLFSASRDRSVKLWDLDQMGLVDTMYGHQDVVMGVSALQKQRVVTAGRQDRSCRLWKVEDESQLLFSGHSACISMDCVAMLNDEHFVSGSADGALPRFGIPAVRIGDVHFYSWLHFPFYTIGFPNRFNDTLLVSKKSIAAIRRYLLSPT